MDGFKKPRLLPFFWLITATEAAMSGAARLVPPATNPAGQPPRSGNPGAYHPAAGAAQHWQGRARARAPGARFRVPKRHRGGGGFPPLLRKPRRSLA